MTIKRFGEGRRPGWSLYNVSDYILHSAGGTVDQVNKIRL
jgi:hypothetical protein